MDNNIVFLLGAGASINAGVPGTYLFVDEFVDHINEPDKTIVKDIINILKKWKGEDIDIELLLETLIKLKNREDEPLLIFYELNNCKIKDATDITSLITRLKDFIKEKSIVTEDKILYYQPLLNFIKEYKTQDIITLNYDICIEQFCNTYKMDYTDGFDVYWNPDNFKNDNYLVRVYKLHGSVMWYHSNRGSYLKLPVMTNESKIALITGEEAVNLMMYPMQKLDYPEPLLELLVLTKKLLVTKCKLLVIVGYSFRDESIKRLVLDAAIKNPDLHIIIIDKNAQSIYENKLKYFDDEHIVQSPLTGRVICLSYKFEKIFPYLKNHYIKYLNECIVSEQACINSEIKGEKSDWFNVINVAAKSEYVEKIMDIMGGKAITPLYHELQLVDIFVKCLLNQYFNNGTYIKYFETELNKLFIELTKIQSEVVLGRAGMYYIQYKFFFRDNSFQNVETLLNVIDGTISFVENRHRLAFEANVKVDNLKNKLLAVRKYLQELEGNRNISDYFELRENEVKPYHVETSKYKNVMILQASPEDIKKFEGIVREVENKKVQELLEEITL